MEKLPFLLKVSRNSKSFMCARYNFYTTLECHRVVKFEDHLTGFDPLPDDKATELMHNQPIFYLQERFVPEGEGYEWNGLLLFSTKLTDEARALAKNHAKELGVVLAFDNPVTHYYYLLIDPKTSDTTDENFKKLRKEYRTLLMQLIKAPVRSAKPDFYVSAFAPNHYDVVDGNALFGTEPNEQPRKMADIIRAFFSNLSKHSA